MTIIILLGIRFMAPSNFYTQLKNKHTITTTYKAYLDFQYNSHPAGQVHVLMGLCNKAPSKSHVAFYMY